MAEIHCRKCKALVLRVREGIGKVAKTQRANMTWADGHSVKPDGVLCCAVCGDKFMFIDTKAAETLSVAGV